MAKTKRKQKKQPDKIRKNNAKHLDSLIRMKQLVYSDTQLIQWNPTVVGSSIGFVSRAREGCLKCTQNAFSNLIGVPLTDKQMCDATTMLKVKLLNHPKIKTTDTYNVQAFAPALYAKTKATCMEAAAMYLGKFLFPKIEFRRFFADITYPLPSKLRVHKNKGYLPMYVMSVFMEDSVERKNWFNKAFAKKEGVLPIGQMHSVSFDLRPGRNVILDDYFKSPLPYTSEAFKAALHFGVMVCYQVVLIFDDDVKNYQAWESSLL